MATCWGPATAEETRKEETTFHRPPWLARNTETSLIFHEVQGSNGRSKMLRVFIRIKNIGDSSVKWTASPLGNVEAELLDPEGKPVSSVSEGANLSSGLGETILLPYGSSLDWLVSQDGIALTQAGDHAYTLCVARQTWPIPIATAPQYSLHLKVYERQTYNNRLPEDLMIDVPAAKIQLTPK